MSFDNELLLGDEVQTLDRVVPKFREGFGSLFVLQADSCCDHNHSLSHTFTIHKITNTQSFTLKWAINWGFGDFWIIAILLLHWQVTLLHYIVLPSSRAQTFSLKGQKGILTVGHRPKEKHLVNICRSISFATHILQAKLNLMPGQLWPTGPTFWAALI